MRMRDVRIDLDVPSDATLQLLGRWRLRVGGADVRIPAPGQRVVALLALRGDAPRSSVAATLWPRRTPEVARAQLRHALSSTARVLPGLIVGLRPALTLLPGLAVDADLLETLRTSGVGSAPLVDRTTRALLLDGTGLLDGWYDPWVVEERERLSALRVQALTALADRALTTGASVEALTLAETAARLDPLSEEPTVLAVRAHVAMGNPALAVRAFVDLRDRFRRELGVDPGPRCLSLIRSLSPEVTFPGSW